MRAPDLGRDGILHAADLFDGAIEIVSVARNNANHQLQIRLHSGKREDRKASFAECVSVTFFFFFFKSPKAAAHHYT